MAKCVITFEDLPENKVKVVCEPNFETMMMMIQSGHEWTSAQGMAVYAMNKIREQSKKSDPVNRIIVPKLY